LPFGNREQGRGPKDLSPQALCRGKRESNWLPESSYLKKYLISNFKISGCLHLSLWIFAVFGLFDLQRMLVVFVIY